MSGPSGTIAASTLVARFAGLFSSIAAAGMLGGAEFGAYALMLAAATLVASIGSLGFGPPLTRAVAGGADASISRNLAGVVIALSALLLIALATLMSLIFSPSLGIANLPGAETLDAVVVIAVWVLGIGLNPLALAVASGHRAFGTTAGLVVSRGLFVATGTVLGAYLVGTAVGVAAFAAGAEIISAGIAIVVLRQQRWVSVGRSPRLGTVLWPGVTAGLAGLAIQFGTWFGQVLLSRGEDGLIATGLFLLASRFTLAITFLPNALAMVALPRLAHEPGREVRAAAARRTLTVTLLVATPASALVGIGLVFFVPRLSPEYSGFTPTLVVMALVGLAMALNNVLGSVAVADQRVRAWVISDWVLAAVLIVMTIILVPRAGAAGLASATLVAFVFSILVLLPRRAKPTFRSGDM